MALTTEFPSFPQQLTRLPFSRNDCIPARPDLLWSVEWGIVRTLTWNEEGASVILGYWGAGDVVGQPLSGVYPYQMECLTSVEATSIPSEQWYRFLDGIIAHSKATEELFSIIRSERVYNRLDKLLIWLGNKFGRSVSQGILIDLRLTHQNIAELIGTTRVTVTKLLKELEEEGKIIRQQRHYIILCRG
ncbi:UNVERIFIED_CONTAM: transcriptional regulator [Euhalothece sp. KZN 001]